MPRKQTRVLISYSMTVTGESKNSKKIANIICTCTLLIPVLESLRARNDHVTVREFSGTMIGVVISPVVLIRLGPLYFKHFHPWARLLNGEIDEVENMTHCFERTRDIFKLPR